MFIRYGKDLGQVLIIWDLEINRLKLHAISLRLYVPLLYNIKSDYINCNRLILFCSDPGGARTLDPLIKSQLLYQLSYGVFYLVVQK